MNSEGVNTEQQGLECLRALRMSVRKMPTCSREKSECFTSVLVPTLTAFLVVPVSEIVSVKRPAHES